MLAESQKNQKARMNRYSSVYTTHVEPKKVKWRHGVTIVKERKYEKKENDITS